MMKASASIFAAFASAALLSSPVMALQRSAQPRSLTQKQQAKPDRNQLRQNLHDAKAAVKNGKPVIIQQRRLLKQLFQNEIRLRKERRTAFDAWDAASKAYKLNPSAENRNRVVQASTAYQPVKGSHLRAEAQSKQASDRLEQLKQYRTATLNRLTEAKRQARLGAPTFLQRARAVFSGPRAAAIRSGAAAYPTTVQFANQLPSPPGPKGAHYARSVKDFSRQVPTSNYVALVPGEAGPINQNARKSRVYSDPKPN